MKLHPLDMPEEQLLKLMEKAIKEGVLSDDFCAKLYGVLATQAYRKGIT